MRKLIRKILREDEWDFVRDVVPELRKGMYLCNKHGRPFEIHGVGENWMTFYQDDVNRTTISHKINYIMSRLKSGTMRICDPLNESNDMDWIENTNPVPLTSWDKPRKGEHLVCLPGFSNISHTKKVGVPALPYAGAGYEEGKVITVDRVSGSTNIGYIVWPAGGPNPGYSTDGIYPFALARI